MTNQDRRYARLPGHVAPWTGHTTSRRAYCSRTQHQSQPPQLHCGPPANQPRSQWFIISRGRPEASSLHGNTALLHSQHHSTADDKIMASKPRPHSTTLTLINIYIYMCGTVVVIPTQPLQYLHIWYHHAYNVSPISCKPDNQFSQKLVWMTCQWRPTILLNSIIKSTKYVFMAYFLGMEEYNLNCNISNTNMAAC